MSTDPLFTTVQRALAGQYSLEREIGRGGMGVVFLAREVELGRLVAVKVLPPAMASDRATRERFLREARTAAGLSHPHIVPIHRVGEAGEIVYFSMMFVDGETLGERLRTRGPLSPSAAIRMLREVSQALAYAHGRGVIHRDIKPDNILLERESGRALVTDFGIAGDSRAEAADAAVLGTIHFMSPEQAAGVQVDSRSDLYSLGVVAHVALSGRLPARLVGSGEISARVSPAGLASTAPGTPRHLVAAIEKSLMIDREGRFASAEAFATAIDERLTNRPALPIAIRTWLSAHDPLRAPYFLWTAAWLLTAAKEFRGTDEFFFVFSLVMSTVPIIPAIVFEFRTLRRLLDAGYSLDDVDASLPVWDAEENEEIASRSSGRPAWFAPVARTIAWAAVGLLVAMGTTSTVIDYMSEVARAAALFAGAAALPVLSALGVSVLPEFAMADKPLRRHFWDSALGRRLERLLQGDRQRLAPVTAFRPTEIVVRTAIDSLWRSLPTMYREHLKEVPGVVKRLEAHAARARATLVRIDERSLIESDRGVLMLARERARKDLEAAVTALESVRLDILRVLGGDTDLAPTTTVLEAARRLDTDLSRLREAQREVDQAIHPLGLDLQTQTPV